MIHSFDWPRGLLLAVTLVACAACATIPPPKARLSTAEDTVRQAHASGASADPIANEYLRAAEAAIATSKELTLRGDNEKAAWAVAKGQADADLSLALAEEARSKKAAAQAGAATRKYATERGLSIPEAPTPNARRSP